MKNTYKNRYGDVFTYKENDHQDILWKGNFEYCRIGMPNDYTEAYNQYLKDNEHVQNLMSFNQFKDVVHEYDDETNKYIYDKYVKLIKSIPDKISMIDPSGGPYMYLGMSLDSFGFKDYVIKEFVPIKRGYKIITEKCEHCHQAGGKHKMSCPTQKIQINL
jgi:hypothetical protein